MVTNRRAHVVILGGGIAGLWTATELTRMGVTCEVVTDAPIGRWSSTRNQGWLQNGALDLLAGYTRLADACRDGAEDLRQLAAAVSEQLLWPVPSYLMFERDDARASQRLERRCSARNINASSHNWEGQRSNCDGIELHSSLTIANEIDGAIIDTRRLLATLVASLPDSTRFHFVEDWNGLSFERRRAEWRINYGSTALSCDLVVAACGARLNPMLVRMGFAALPNFDVWTLPVLALHGPLPDALVAIPSVEYAPHLVPFAFGNIRASTVLLTRYRDEEVVGPAPAARLDQLPDDHMNFIARQLGNWVPSIMRQVDDGEEILARGYRCQMVHVGWADEPFIRDEAGLGDTSAPPTIAWYPGRLTAASVRARDCAARIAEKLDMNVAVSRAFMANAATPQLGNVALQAFMANPTHKLVVRDRALGVERKISSPS